jgi:hypothetical protein
VACIGEMRTVYRTLVGNNEEKRSLGRLSHRCKIILEWIFEK